MEIDETKYENEETKDVSKILWWRKLRTILIWLFAVANFMLLSFFLLFKFEFLPQDWSLFLNGRGPQAWLNTLLVLSVIWMTDWLTGHQPTIKNILEINDKSCWQCKAVAAAFLLGIGALALYGATH